MPYLNILTSKLHSVLVGQPKKRFACSDNNRVVTTLALPNRKPKRTITEGNPLPRFSWCNESSETNNDVLPLPEIQLQ